VREGANETRRRAFADAGVELIDVPPGPAGGQIDLGRALQALGHRGLTRLLVEGGGGLAAALLAADLVDRIAWFRAPMIVGGDGRPAVGPFGIVALAAAPRFERTALEPVGEDVLETLRRAP
jgi:diaminohydroxyphosphoribosylaminopyrimidine deaminase/5-amino-6-(5-phosphoribosylamino)uracil reductase